MREDNSNQSNNQVNIMNYLMYWWQNKLDVIYTASCIYFIQLIMKYETILSLCEYILIILR